MYNEDNHYEVLKNFTKTILNFKLFVGCILIIVGIYIAVQIVSIVIAILMTPDKVPFFELIKRLEPNGIAFISNDGSASIPETLFSYTVASIMLLAIASLSKKILSLGIEMVNIEIKNLLDELLKEWREIRQARQEKKDTSGY